MSFKNFLLILVVGTALYGTGCSNSNTNTKGTNESTHIPAPDAARASYLTASSPKDHDDEISCEDTLNLEENVLDDEDTSAVYNQMAFFKDNFHWGTTASNQEWNNTSLTVPVAELMKLYKCLDLERPKCHDKHYLTALKLWLGAEDNGHLTILFQPVVMLRDGDETSGDHEEEYEYTVGTPPGGVFYKLNAKTNTLDTLAGPVVDTAIYQRTMVSKKYEKSSTYDKFWQDNNFYGDTKYAIFPFQEVLKVCESYTPDESGKVTFIHAADTYKLRGLHPFTKKRWKHHFFVSAQKRGQSGKVYVEESRSKYADYGELYPPPHNSVIYRILTQ